MKKTVFYTILVMILLMFLASGEALGILPYIIVAFMMYENLFQKKNRTTPIGVMAIIMGFLNFVVMFDEVYAAVDVVAWMSILGTFGVERKK